MEMKSDAAMLSRCVRGEGCRGGHTIHSDDVQRMPYRCVCVCVYGGGGGGGGGGGYAIHGDDVQRYHAVRGCILVLSTDAEHFPGS